MREDNGNCSHRSLSGDLNTVPNWIGHFPFCLRRKKALSFRFDTEQPTLLDLEVVNNRDKSARVAHAPLPAGPVASAVAHGGGNPSSAALIKPQFGLRYWNIYHSTVLATSKEIF